MVVELLLAFGFATIALVASLCFVFMRHPVYAALSFSCAVLATAGIYLMYGAAFVAASNIVVYAGATIIIFLFVLMFAQRPTLESYDLHMTQPFFAGLVAIGFASVVAYAVISERKPFGEPSARESNNIAAIGDIETKGDAQDANSATLVDLNPRSTDAKQVKVVILGRELYTHYLLAIEVAGTLLLVATIGAILISQQDESSTSKGESLD